MKTYTTERYIHESRNISYEYIDGSNKYVKYTDTITTTINGKSCNKTIIGYTSIDNVEKVINSDSCAFKPILDKVYQENMYNNWGRIVGIYKNDIENIKSGKLHISEAINDYNDDGYMIPVIWNVCSYRVNYLDGTPFVLPIQFDYISGVDNEHYKLSSVKEHLQTLKNIGRNIFVKSEREIVEISCIPYYNSTEYCNSHIEFTYLPSQEEYNKYISIEDGYSKTSNIELKYDYILNDVLGLRDYLKYKE